MVIILVFAAILLVAALLSQKATQSILSTAVIFLVAGFLSGKGVMGVVKVEVENPIVAKFAELALFSVLFNDGMRVNARKISWSGSLKEPGRALLIGLPLTILGNAALAHWLVGLPWLEAFLLGAVLGPTDPVFAAAIVSREEVPYRLRHLLNLESGFNDGLALPVIVLLLALISADNPDLLKVLGDVGLGIGLGVVIPALVIWMMKLSFLKAVSVYQPLLGFATGLLVLSLSSLVGANQFLAAFAAGITVGTLSPRLKEQFHRFGETITELLKLSALFIFGAILEPGLFTGVGLWGYLFGVLVLVLVRPVTLGIALLGTRLSWQEWLAGGWFGPKGFSSVFYALLVWEAGIPGGSEIFNLASVVITASIIAHSSTDVLVVRWFKHQNQPSQQPTKLTGAGGAGEDQAG